MGVEEEGMLGAGWENRVNSGVGAPGARLFWADDESRGRCGENKHSQKCGWGQRGGRGGGKTWQSGEIVGDRLGALACVYIYAHNQTHTRW